jgi:hypothetical protein
MMTFRALCNYDIVLDVVSRDADEIFFCSLNGKEIRILFLISI